MSPREQDPAERRLVEDCLAGKREAWEEVYDRLLRRAPSAIYRARKSAKRYAPEEIAGEVWVCLRDDKEKLQAFLHGTKRLDAFLDSQLWSTVRHQAQAEKRRDQGRVPLSQTHVRDLRITGLPLDIREELDKRLTRAEKKYLDAREKAPEGAPPYRISDRYARTLEESIERKLRELLREQ